MASYSRKSPRPNEGERADVARAAPYFEDEHSDFGEYDAEVRLCSYCGPCHDYTERFVSNSPYLLTRGSYYPSTHFPDDGRESDNWSDENEQDEIWVHRYGTHESCSQNGEEFRNSVMNPYDSVRDVGSPDELTHSRPDSPPHSGCWADLENEEGIREGNSGTLTSRTFSRASEYRYGMYEPYLSVTDPDTLQNDIIDERSASLSEYKCGMYEPSLSSVTDLVTLQSEITEQRSANPSAYADHEPFEYEKGEKPMDEGLQPDLSISAKRRDEQRFQPLPSTSGNAYRNNLLAEGERYGKTSLFSLGMLHSPADSIDYEPPLIKQVHEDGCCEDSDDALSACSETCGHKSHNAKKSDNQSMSDSNLSSDFSGHGYEADDSSDEEDCNTTGPFCQHLFSHNRREMDTAHTMDESYSDASYHATLVKEIIDDSSTSPCSTRPCSTRPCSTRPSARVVSVPEPYQNEKGSTQKDENLQPDMIISGKQRKETGFQHVSPAARNVYRNIFLCGEERNGRNSDTLFELGHSTRPKDCLEDNPLHIPTEIKGDKQESRIDTCRTKSPTLRLLLKKSEEETVSMPFKEKGEEKEADNEADREQETLPYSFRDICQYTHACMEDSDDALSVCSHPGTCYDIHHSAGTSEYMSMGDVHSTVFSGFLDDEHECGHWSDEEEWDGIWPYCNTTAFQNIREIKTAHTMEESYSDASCHISWAPYNRREMDTAHTMDESYSDASCHNSWASHNRCEMETALTMNEANSDASYHATLVKEIIDDSSARLSAMVVPQSLPNKNWVRQTCLQPDPFISGEEIAETAFQHLPTTSRNAYRNNFLFSKEQNGENNNTLYEGGFSLGSKDFFEHNSSYIPTESNDDTEEPNTSTYQTLDEKDDIPVSDDEEANDFRSPMISDCHQMEAEGSDSKSKETEESTFGNTYQQVLATRPSAELEDGGATGHRTIADGRDWHTTNEGTIDESRNKSSNRTFTTAIKSETGLDIVFTKDEYHSDASEKLPSRDKVSGENPASTSSEMISGTFQRIARGLKRDSDHLQQDFSTHTEPGVKTNLHSSYTKPNGDRIRRFGIEEQHRQNWDTLCEQGLWHKTNDCFEYSSLEIPKESNGVGDETNIASHQARANAFCRQEKMAQEDTVQMLAEGDEDMSLWSFTNDKELADYERGCLDCDSMPSGEDLNNHRTESPKKSNRSTTNKEHNYVGAKFDVNHERVSKVIIKNSSKCEASNVDIQQRDEVTTLRLSLGNMLIKQKARKRLDLKKLFLCVYGCSIPEDEEKDKHSQSCQSEGECDSEDEDEYLLLHQKKDKTSAKTGRPRSTSIHQERDSFVHRQEREETSFARDDLESNYTLPSDDQCHRVAKPGNYMQDNNENLGQGKQATHEPADVTENPGNVSVGDFRTGHNEYTGKSKQNAVLLKVPDENHTCTNKRNGDDSCQEKSDTFHSLQLKQALSEICNHVNQIENVEEFGRRDASLFPDLSHETDRDDRTFSAQQISDDINEAQNGCDQTFLCGDALLEAQPSSLRTNGLLATSVTENKPSASDENPEDGVVGLTCADEYSAGQNQEATGTSFLSSLQQLQHGFIACAENTVDIDAQTDAVYPKDPHEHTVLRNNPTRTQAEREDAYKKGLISTDNIGDQEFQSTRRNLDSDICNAELDQHKGEDDGTTEQGQYCMHDEVVPIGHTGSVSETDFESTCKHTQTANQVSSDVQRQGQWENHPKPGHDAHVKTRSVVGVTSPTEHKPTFLPWPGSPDPAYDDEIREGPQIIDREPPEDVERPLPSTQAQQPQRLARREVETPSAVIRDDLVERRVRDKRQLSHRIASASPEPQGIARGDGETPTAFIHDVLVEQGTCGTRRLPHRRISSASLQSLDVQGIAGREGETPSAIICHDLVEHRARDERQLPDRRIPSALLPQPEPQGIAGRMGEPGSVVIEHGARVERRLPHPRIPYTAHPCCCPQCLLIHLRTTIGLSAGSVPFPELCQEDDESYRNSGRGGR